VTGGVCVCVCVRVSNRAVKFVPCDMSEREREKECHEEDCQICDRRCVCVCVCESRTGVSSSLQAAEEEGVPRPSRFNLEIPKLGFTSSTLLRLLRCVWGGVGVGVGVGARIGVGVGLCV